MNHTFRADTFGGYSITQWETCQTNDDQCLLDNVSPTNPAAFSPPKICSQGGVPSYYIDVTGPTDVATAFKFVRKTKTRLVIKNSGHDYLGRSLAPGSLALWTHHLKKLVFERNFIAEGCSGTSVAGTTAFTIGAGQQFGEIYDFSEANNVTFIGGADITVGASGGWVQGGGHSAMSPAMGLGVDRVLQFKIVTPDGKYRTVNKCQHQDLFFALRGGGGSTFGVVLESTFLVTPRVDVQVVLATFDVTPERVKTVVKSLAANSVKWAADAWGGYINVCLALYANPNLDATAARKSMEPLETAFKALGGNVTFSTSPSFPAFFRTFIRDHQDPVGVPFHMASRLIPASEFNNSQLVDAMADGLAGCNFPQVLAVTPYAFKQYDNNTAVTPAWRDSVWHVILSNTWNFDATKADRVALLTSLETLMKPIRELTPGSGAYFNEADVYEPDHERSYWGNNYPALLKSNRNSIDPDGILECWQCVGWKGKQDPRYKCYLDISP
ncbi:FAD-binding domain-containing protein [Infundibulicybe gibba]|nr:FAD-binding domain-containing protein [Infundibulicybe gibba]